jgi:hypothetical protein
MTVEEKVKWMTELRNAISVPHSSPSFSIISSDTHTYILFPDVTIRNVLSFVMRNIF